MEALKRGIPVLGAVLALGLAGCGDDESDVEEALNDAVVEELGDIPTTELSTGQITRAGKLSSTVTEYCLNEATREDFEDIPGGYQPLPGAPTEEEAEAAAEGFLETVSEDPDDPGVKPMIEQVAVEGKKCPVAAEIVELHQER
jgi:hypothetical protein